MDGKNRAFIKRSLNPVLLQVSEGDFPVLEDLVKKIVKEKQPFERLVMKKSDLKEMFEYNQFKIRILDEKVRGQVVEWLHCYVVKWLSLQ